MQQITCETMASNPNIGTNEVAKLVNISPETVRKYKRNPQFNEAVYNRFMEISGGRLVQVVDLVQRIECMGRAREETERRPAHVFDVDDQHMTRIIVLCDAAARPSQTRSFSQVSLDVAIGRCVAANDGAFSLPRLSHLLSTSNGRAPVDVLRHEHHVRT